MSDDPRFTVKRMTCASANGSGRPQDGWSVGLCDVHIAAPGEPLQGEVLAPGTSWAYRSFYDGKRWSAKWVGAIHTYPPFGPLL